MAKICNNKISLIFHHKLYIILQKILFLDGIIKFVAICESHYKIFNYHSRHMLITREIVSLTHNFFNGILKNYLGSLHRFVDKDTNQSMFISILPFRSLMLPKCKYQCLHLRLRQELFGLY